MEDTVRKPLVRPSVKAVEDACKCFDSDNRAAEDAVGKLFALFASNTDMSNVLLKVAAVNQFYSTQIFAVVDVAKHICSIGEEIDSALSRGVPEIVDRIAKVTIKEKVRNNFSFASKYCSWHQPEHYPIWDSRVDRYLRRLQGEAPFCSSFGKPDNWDYPAFRGVMECLRGTFGLQGVSFKKIDKFLYTYGESVSVNETPCA